MFSKAVLTFLAIGALWLNVSAIPIPPFPPNPFKDPTGRLDISAPFTSHTQRPPTWYGYEDEDPAPQPKRKSSLLMWGGELPRSFSALSYRHLTFVFSVAGGTVATTVGTGIGVGILEHKNHTRREFELESEGSNSAPSLPVLKREPMPEDEASDSLSSPLERDPEPAPPSL